MTAGQVRLVRHRRPDLAPGERGGRRPLQRRPGRRQLSHEMQILQTTRFYRQVKLVR
jgi:hypothetical protein